LGVGVGALVSFDDGFNETVGTGEPVGASVSPSLSLSIDGCGVMDGSADTVGNSDGELVAVGACVDVGV
jgi:hypothetical protein